MDADTALFEQVLFGPDSEGAVHVTWEAGTRCDCYTADTHQPQWGHEACKGLGVIYAAPVAIRALFRGQSRWQGRHAGGNLALGDAQLTTLPAHKPGYVDDRIRDRFTILDAPGDQAPGVVFYPAAQPVPFVFAGVQRAWRVQLQSLENAARILPQ